MEEIISISELKNAYALSGNETFVVNQKNPIDKQIETRYATLEQLMEFIKLEVNDSLQEVMPIGSIKAYTGKITTSTNIPGWLLCNGDMVSRSKYKKLYDVIGNIYGSTSSDSFKLPDLRGRVIMGYCNGSSALVPKFGNWKNGSSITLGKYDGKFYHKLTESELPTHTHPNSHTHKYFNIANMNSVYIDFYENPIPVRMAPFGSPAQYPSVIAVAPGPLAKKAINQSLDNSATFTPDVSAYIGETSSAGGYTGSAGENEPHNNMQPYVAINYLIKY
jgi:microcystin-dependent protein